MIIHIPYQFAILYFLPSVRNAVRFVFDHAPTHNNNNNVEARGEREKETNEERQKNENTI